MGETKEAMSLAVDVGETMLKNGAEIYRVEDTIIHILKRFEVKEYSVYVLSNGIFASANENQPDACSIVRHVPLGSVNLEMISVLNQLTRDICSTDCSIEEARGELEKCSQVKGYSYLTQLFFCGLGSGCFCYLFGGSAFDGLISFCIGFVEQILLFACIRHKLSKFIMNLLAALFVTVISFGLLFAGVKMQQDKIIIGSIMPLVPGIAFTTSIRDFYRADYLSGTIHLVDALITAVCIAIGATLPFFLYRYWGGVL